MAAYVELYMDQGSTFENVLTVTDDLTNAPINITGYSFSSQIRRSYYSINPTANIVCSISDANNGVLIMSLAASNTASIKAGRYLFDLESVNTLNNTSRILEGIITVTPGVTR